MTLLALAALVLAGCGGSSAPKGPPALVFVSTKDGDYAIFGADADGKHVRRLTKEKGDPATPAGLFFQNDPAWSPDGSRIAFVSRRDGTSHIYVMDADGTGTRRLTDTSQDDNRPAWSPDSRHIVFSREGALFQIASGGGSARRLLLGLGSAENPAWSPDGRWIAYDYRQPGYSIRELYIAHPDGTGKLQVTHLQAVSARPAWSPQGTQLAFDSDVYAHRDEVYTVRLDGKDVKRTTTSQTAAVQPNWSREGLVYSLDGAIWVDRGGKQTQLTTGANNDSSPAWRPSQPG